MQRKKTDNKMKQISLEDSLLSSSHSTKYGSEYPRQIELTDMVVKDSIIGLDLPLSVTEKPAFIRAMTTFDSKFNIPLRR